MYVSDLLAMYKYCSTIVIYLIVILEHCKYSCKENFCHPNMLFFVSAVCLTVGNLVKSAKQLKKNCGRHFIHGARGSSVFSYLAFQSASALTLFNSY